MHGTEATTVRTKSAYHLLKKNKIKQKHQSVLRKQLAIFEKQRNLNHTKIAATEIIS